MPAPSELTIRSATVEDVPLLLELIQEFAAHVRMSNRVIATESLLRQTLFGPQPYAEVLMAEWSDEPVGYAVFFPSYSTFRGQPGLFLEDLFVRRSARGRGIGRALLASVAKAASDRGCGRLEWSTLDWNEAAIGFYCHLGAQAHRGSTTFGLLGDALSRLADEA
jgi:GNAT superfamily N-acetyltransferase